MVRNGFRPSMLPPHQPGLGARQDLELEASRLARDARRSHAPRADGGDEARLRAALAQQRAQLAEAGEGGREGDWVAMFGFELVSELVAIATKRHTVFWRVKDKPRNLIYRRHRVCRLSPAKGMSLPFAVLGALVQWIFFGSLDVFRGAAKNPHVVLPFKPRAAGLFGAVAVARTRGTPCNSRDVDIFRFNLASLFVCKSCTLTVSGHALTSDDESLEP